MLLKKIVMTDGTDGQIPISVMIMADDLDGQHIHGDWMMMDVDDDDQRMHEELMKIGTDGKYLQTQKKLQAKHFTFPW